MTAGNSRYHQGNGVGIATAPKRSTTAIHMHATAATASQPTMSHCFPRRDMPSRASNPRSTGPYADCLSTLPSLSAHTRSVPHPRPG